jgi:hypothetical protein
MIFVLMTNFGLHKDNCFDWMEWLDLNAHFLAEELRLSVCEVLISPAWLLFRMTDLRLGKRRFTLNRPNGQVIG